MDTSKLVISTKQLVWEKSSLSFTWADICSRLPCHVYTVYPFVIILTWTISDPFYQHDLTLIPAWISNLISYKMWGEITYPLPNFNGATVEVWEWISNFTPHFTGHVITYPCRAHILWDILCIWVDWERWEQLSSYSANSRIFFSKLSW